MALGPDPFVALLQAVSDAQAASGAGASAPFAPGAQGITAQGVQAGDATSGPPGPGGLAALGTGGGSVPGTASTGPNLARSIVEGSIAPGSPGAMSVMDAVERGGEGPERPFVAGGDVGALLSILGGPTAALTFIPSLVASDALGMPPDPTLLSTTSLAELAMGAGAGDSTPGVTLDRGGPDIVTGGIPSEVKTTVGGQDRIASMLDRERATGPERNRDVATSGGFSGSRSTAR